MSSAVRTTTTADGVVVVEPPLPRRARRPADLLRLLVAAALMVLTLALGALAANTGAGLEQDLLGAATGLPRLLLLAVTYVAGVGTLALPVAAALDLVVRRRPWQLVDALLAAGLAVAFSLGFRYWVTKYEPLRLLEALTKIFPDGTRSTPVEILLVTIVAFLTVTDLRGRRGWRAVSVLLVGAVAVTGVLGGDVTVLATAFSILLGWTIGLAVRYGLGAASTRPDGAQVATAARAAGIPLVRMERILTDSVEPRRYLGVATDGGAVRLEVLDHDTYGSNIGYRLWRRLRLRRPATRRTFYTVRSAVDHEALMALAVRHVGVRTPELLAVSEVGPYAALVAYQMLTGRTLDAAAAEGDAADPPAHPPSVTASPVTAASVTAAEGTQGTDPALATVTLAEEATPLDDHQLAQAWEALAALQQAQISHRGLTDDNLLLTPDGGVALLGVSSGDVASADLPLRLDVAQLLTTLALHVGAQRAVSSALPVIGPEQLVRALPLLQSIALGRPTRGQLRHQKRLLHDLRQEIIDVTPGEEPVEEIQLERLRPRTILAVVGGTVAAYLLVTQLSGVDFRQIVTNANWWWAAVALAFSALTYVGATVTIMGTVVQVLSFLRCLLTQLAVSFTSLVAPTAVGNVALNARFLERSGVDGAVAVASVGLAQVGMFVSYIVLIVLAGVLAGTGPQASFSPPAGALVIVIAVLFVAILGLSLPWGRRLLQERLRPMLHRVVPRIVAVFQRPRKLAQLLGGALLLNTSYVLCLMAATRAFGGGLGVATVAVVYFAGAVVGSAVPTPGGLGGVEAALTAGLTAAGMDGGVALSAVLLFRVVTYWLPVPLGWLSLNYLQRKGAL